MVEDEEKEAVRRSKEDDDEDQMKKKRRIEGEVDTCEALLCSIGTCKRPSLPRRLLQRQKPCLHHRSHQQQFPHRREVDKLGFKSGVEVVARSTNWGFAPSARCTPSTGPWVGGSSNPFSSRKAERGWVFFRGKLYFLLIDNCCNGFFVGVLCFDVAKEKFSEVPGPAQLSEVQEEGGSHGCTFDFRGALEKASGWVSGCSDLQCPFMNAMFGGKQFADLYDKPRCVGNVRFEKVFYDTAIKDMLKNIYEATGVAITTTTDKIKNTDLRVEDVTQSKRRYSGVKFVN
ncbi:hypothetical protein QJS10_CPB19g01113 [Acorus calamus]|uniref:Uncharacterized protein n=1 Tax=Acorus calamus TaxID=4465 RepID=A0AAV9CGA1_ACOCL|nr:hypothetical protein QJS10_CPB19g01113 [Acorus calamus]